MKQLCINWSKASYLIASTPQGTTGPIQTDSAIIVDTQQIPNGETWYVKQATASFIFSAVAAIDPKANRLSGLFLCPPSTPPVANDGGVAALASNFTSRPISLPLDDGASQLPGGANPFEAGFTFAGEFFVIPSEWFLRAVVWQGSEGPQAEFAWLVLQYIIDRQNN